MKTNKTPTEEIQVTSCNNCPFCETFFNNPTKGKTTSTCLSPSVFHSIYKVDKYWRLKTTPRFCPLKKAKLFIHLK